jgi:hypothetical protein
MSPIKPENKARYPKNWKEIRARIQARAGNACEGCEIPNGMFRVPSGAWSSDIDAAADMLEDGERLTRIVCTVAHLDHTPENCSDDNLRFWCQRCHLAYDQEHHQQTAYATRRAGRAIDMFE